MAILLPRSRVTPDGGRWWRRQPHTRAALFALVLALSAGCAPTFSKEQDTTSERLVAGHARPLPGFRWLDADVKRVGDAALVHVTAERACVRPLVWETTLDRETKARPSAGGLVMDPLLPVGALVYPFAFYLPLLLAPLLGGTIALAIDLTKYSTENSRSVARRAAGVTPARCTGGSTARPGRVELSLADGTRLAAALDARGHARIALPPELWTTHGGRLDFDVRVDGILVSRAVLEHAP